MSMLNLRIRPEVVFDPDNKDHRRYYSDFIRHRTWGKCPVRFVVDDASHDVVYSINRRLLAYYVNREFLK